MTTKNDNLRRGADALAQYVPPHSIEAEQAVLGAMLIASAAVDEAAGALSEASFYRDAHGLLFAAMVALRKRREPVDLVTVQDELRRCGHLDAAGGMAYLTALLDSVPSAALAGHYAGIVGRYASLRRLIEGALTVVGDARSLATGEDVDALIERAHALIDEARPAGADEASWETADAALDRAYARMEAARNGDMNAAGIISTGLYTLDEMLYGGVRRGELTILGARPSMGKSSLVGKIVSTAMRRETRTLVVSTEVDNETVILRLLCSDAGVQLADAKRGVLPAEDWEALSVHRDSVRGAPCRLWSEDKWLLGRLDSRIRAAVRKWGVELLVVDHIGHIDVADEGRAENRNAELTLISRRLKTLARSLNLAVVAAAQLSRRCETREDKRPMLSDLRDSGAIEQDADVVIGLYRADYYAKPEQRLPPDQTQEVEALLLKGRDIGTGVVKLAFTPRWTRFADFEQGGLDDEY